MSGLFSDLDKWQLADVRKRQKTARRVLAECGGIVEGPVRVEAFTGGLIARFSRDYRCDRRGRARSDRCLGEVVPVVSALFIWNGNAPVFPPCQPNHWTLIWVARAR